MAPDRWLSERFGHPLYSVDSDVGDDVEAIQDHARGHDAVSYQARVPVGQTDQTSALTDVGFDVVNVTVTLVRDLEPVAVSGGAVEIRAADPSLDAAVLDIAERGITQSRFHLDPAIPLHVADRIKRDWAANSLDGRRGDGMLVALRDGEPVGFLAGLTAEADVPRAHIIDLIAVDPAARDVGVGAALVARFVSQARDEHSEVRVGTQAANHGATRFYERLGFRPSARTSDLHLHVGACWKDD